MFELLAGILLSRYLVALIIIGMLALMTRWAWQANAQAGYGLGWLIAIFFFVLIGMATGGEIPEIGAASERPPQTVFVGLLLGMIGSVIGFFSFSILRMIGSGRRRSLTIAILTATLLLTMFFLVIVPVYVNQLIGILFLAYTIGALTNVVVGQRSNRAERPLSAGSGQNAPAPADDRWQATRNRLNRFQRRVSNQRPELREEDQQGRAPYENVDR